MSGQQGSRWGSLLSGAVAGLESRLDTILAEDSQASAKSRAAEQAEKQRLQAETGVCVAVDWVTRSSRRRAYTLSRAVADIVVAEQAQLTPAGPPGPRRQPAQ